MFDSETPPESQKFTCVTLVCRLTCRTVCLADVPEVVSMGVDRAMLRWCGVYPQLAGPFRPGEAGWSERSELVWCCLTGEARAAGDS